ncbi:unnamed protein product [Arabis nemorensis]|uniref:RING-type E3 ubiquitin transferase n=1 Tax=Arabis nemorensis TaxID=586526 RepID=A0A565BGJ1_9BRAS|nr:unnamed protein product [Arabis nemorensis]
MAALLETSSHTTPTGSTRWRLFSESESEDFDNDSNALYRFSAYGGDSDASTDRHGFLDERGFEELLEQLAESDNSRRGAPPASVSCVRNLPWGIIGEEHVKKGLLCCAVCKDLFTLGNETTQLPCLHLYHAHCIVPWLSARNSCPLCRFELPTDDKDYEEGKQNVLDVSEDSSSSDDDTDAGEEEYVERGESESGVSRVGRGRWLFLAAAPVVSLVGVVLAMWLSNPQRRDIVISHSQRGNRTRRCSIICTLIIDPKRCLSLISFRLSFITC